MDVKWENTTSVDLSVRASTLHRLKETLLSTGSWNEPTNKVNEDGSRLRNIGASKRNTCVFLKRTDLRGNKRCCKYLRLWTEEPYGLKIRCYKSFVSIKTTNQLEEKIESKDLVDDKGYCVIGSCAQKIYVPTLLALLDALTRNISHGRRGMAFRSANAFVQLRALVTTNYLLVASSTLGGPSV